MPKLAVQVADLNELCSYGADDEQLAWFVKLVSQCLSLGLLDPLDRLMQAGAQVLAESMSGFRLLTPPRTHLITSLLQPLTSVLDKQDASPTPAIKGFLEAALCRQLRWPEYPHELPGWPHRQRSCGVSACSLCSSLSTFLQSATQRETVLYPGARSAHVEGLLSSKQFSYKTTRGGPRNKYMMTVRKPGREIHYDLENHRELVKKFRKDIEPLRGDCLKKFLAEESYRDTFGDEEPVPSTGAPSGQSLDGGRRLGGEAVGGQRGGVDEASPLGGQPLGGEALGGRLIGGQPIPLRDQKSGGPKRAGGHEDVEEADVKRPRTNT